MVATLYQNIRGALQTRLASVTGIPTIAYEDRRYTPVPGTPFIEAILIPISGRPQTMGDDPLLLHEGTFQIACVYPAGKGTGKAEAMADTIKGFFKVKDVLTLNGDSVRIRYSERVRALEEADWLRVPVSIGWYLYSPEY